MIPEMFFNKDINCIELNRCRATYVDEIKAGNHDGMIKASNEMFKHIEKCKHVPCSIFTKLFGMLDIPINPENAKPEDFKKVKDLMGLEK